MKKDNILLKQNGDVITFINGSLSEEFKHINVDEVLIDGKSQNDVGELVLKDREMLAEAGIVLVTATLDKKTKEIIYFKTKEAFINYFKKMFSNKLILFGQLVRNRKSVFGYQIKKLYDFKN